MMIPANASRLYAIAIGAFLMSACGHENADPVAGSWSFSGSVPDIVTVQLSLDPDRTFTFVENVAPLTRPAGFVDNGCVTTDSYCGAYDDQTLANGQRILMLDFQSGTVNAVSGCSINESPGRPTTPDEIESFRSQGTILATSESYSVSPTTLVLTPTGGVGPGIGLANRSATFRRILTVARPVTGQGCSTHGLTGDM